MNLLILDSSVPYPSGANASPGVSLAPDDRSQARRIDTYIAILLQSKEGRSGSTGTLRAYHEIITHFREALQSRGLDLDGNRSILQTIAQERAALPWRADRQRDI